MTNIPHLIDANQRRWEAMRYKTDRIKEFETSAKQLIAHKAQYQEISKVTGVPWAIVAVTDLREHETDLGLCNSYLGNGQSLNRVTTIVPKGRGPFFDHDNDLPLQGAFYRGALDALIDVQHANQWHDWTPGGATTFTETLNGLGYVNKGLASPYVWGGTSEQQPGKYVSDGVFDATEWDIQLGTAGLIRMMSLLDASAGYPPPITIPPKPPVPTPVPVPVPVPVPPLPDHPPPLDITTQVLIGNTMNAILQLVLGNPTLMALLTSVISNPQIVAMITQVLNSLSTQVGTGVPPATAIQNLILTQFDLDQAAAVVAAEAAKLGPPPWNIDQQREMAALVIRSYIANTKAGK